MEIVKGIHTAKAAESLNVMVQNKKLIADLERIESTLRTTQTELSESRRDYADQRDKFSDQQVNNAKVVSQWTSELEALRTEKKPLSDEIGELQSTCNNKDCELTTVRAELSEYKEKCGAADEKVKQLIADLRNASGYKNLYEESTSGFNTLRDNYNALAIELEAAKENVRNKADDLKKSRESSARLNSTLNTTKTELEGARTELENIRNRSLQLNSELDAAKKCKKRDDTELQKCRKSLQESDSSLDKSRRNVNKLNDDLRTVKQNLEDEREKCKTITATVNTLRSELERVKENYGIVNENLSQSRFKSSEVESQLASIRRELESNKNELQTTKTKLSTATGTVRNMEDKLRQTVAESTETSKMAQSTMTNNEQRITLLESNLKEAAELNKRLEYSNGEMLGQIQNLEKQIDILRNEKKKCEEDITRLNNALNKQASDHRAKCDELQSQCESQLVALRESVNTLKQENVRRDDQLRKSGETVSKLN
ncbi:hypothetical protein MHBO_001578, partial [Bonamia ostreae]